MLGFAVVMIAVCLPGIGQQATAESNTAASAAQELGQDQHFRLAFVVRETDEKGKVLNSREYEAMTAAIPHTSNSSASIRAGAKVPVPTSPDGAQITYMDVGVNFDVSRFQVLSSTRVGMYINADISSFDPASDPAKRRPVIHQNRWSGNEQITLGERQVIFSSDDLTSKNKLQVELMVTRVE
jgi:hypothetical protein